MISKSISGAGTFFLPLIWNDLVKGCHEISWRSVPIVFEGYSWSACGLPQGRGKGASTMIRLIFVGWLPQDVRSVRSSLIYSRA